MNAFEALISMLLRHEGYWTTPSFKVMLSKAARRKIGLPSAPRWELDLIAYQGSTNRVLIVECKSFLDSVGVVFRNGKFEPPQRYKLFTNATLRRAVIKQLIEQLVSNGACAANPQVTLCLAAGNIATKTDALGLRKEFHKQGWELFDRLWIRKRLENASKMGYENDIAFIVSKILLKDVDVQANLE